MVWRRWRRLIPASQVPFWIRLSNASIASSPRKLRGRRLRLAAARPGSPQPMPHDRLTPLGSGFAARMFAIMPQSRWAKAVASARIRAIAPSRTRISIPPSGRMPRAPDPRSSRRPAHRCGRGMWSHDHRRAAGRLGTRVDLLTASAIGVASARRWATACRPASTSPASTTVTINAGRPGCSAEMDGSGGVGARRAIVDSSSLGTGSA